MHELQRTGNRDLPKRSKIILALNCHNLTEICSCKLFTAWLKEMFCNTAERVAITFKILRLYNAQYVRVCGVCVSMCVNIHICVVYSLLAVQNSTSRLVGLINTYMYTFCLQSIVEV